MAAFVLLVASAVVVLHDDATWAMKWVGGPGWALGKWIFIHFRSAGKTWIRHGWVTMRRCYVVGGHLKFSSALLSTYLRMMIIIIISIIHQGLCSAGKWIWVKAARRFEIQEYVRRKFCESDLHLRSIIHMFMWHAIYCNAVDVENFCMDKLISSVSLFLLPVTCLQPILVGKHF